MRGAHCDLTGWRERFRRLNGHARRPLCAPDFEGQQRACGAERETCADITQIVRVDRGARERQYKTERQKERAPPRQGDRKHHERGGARCRVPAGKAVHSMTVAERREIKTPLFDQQLRPRLSDHDLERVDDESAAADRGDHRERPARNVATWVEATCGFEMPDVIGVEGRITTPTTAAP